MRILGIHNTQLPQELQETFLLSTEGKLKDLLFLGGFCKVPLKPANAPRDSRWGMHFLFTAHEDSMSDFLLLVSH